MLKTLRTSRRLHRTHVVQMWLESSVPVGKFRPFKELIYLKEFVLNNRKRFTKVVTEELYMNK